jgi:O-antigen/teichoic acid export membrane protein
LILRNKYKLNKISSNSFNLATYSAAYALVAVIHKGLGFILFFWLAHGLSQSEYAIFGLSYTLQSGLVAIATAGVIEMVIGRHRAQPDQQGRQRLYSVGNGLFIWLTLLAVTVALGLYFGILVRYINFWLVTLIFVGSILLAFFTLQASFFRLDESHRQSLLLIFLPPVLGLVFAYIGFAVWGTLEAFFGGMAAALLIVFFILLWMNLVSFRLTMRVAKLVSIKREIAPYIIIALLAWMSGYGSTYLIESIFDMAYVAKFTFVYTLSSILQIAATALNQVWSPRFFKLAHELPLIELERRNMIFYAGQGVVLGLIGFAVIFLLRPAVDLVGGNLVNYRDTGKDLAWLFAGYAVAIPWWHTQNYYYANKQGGALMWLVAFSTALGVIFWLSLMHNLGEQGIYAGFFVLMLIRSIVVWIHARLIWHIRLTWHGPLTAIVVLVIGVLVADKIWH